MGERKSTPGRPKSDTRNWRGERCATRAIGEPNPPSKQRPKSKDRRSRTAFSGELFRLQDGKKKSPNSDLVEDKRTRLELNQQNMKESWKRARTAFRKRKLKMRTTVHIT